MKNQIKIMAEPQMESNKCCFTLDQNVVDEGYFSFSRGEPTQGSVLADALLAIEGVEHVMLAENTVLVCATAAEPDWHLLGKDVGQAIRTAFESKKELVGAAAKERTKAEAQLRAKIEKVIEKDINPEVAGHGGFIELVDVRGKDLFLRMGGGCQGCAMALYTLRQGVEGALRDAVPEIGQVYDVTDHGGGEKPYH